MQFGKSCNTHLQNFLENITVKNAENESTIGEVMIKNQTSCFFETVYYTYRVQ